MMDIPNLLGWLAASLVLTSFYLRTMVPLRLVALASNLAFIAYGFQVGATPVFVLHSVLLPLNVFRLLQIWQFKKLVESVSRDATSTSMLLPHMRGYWAPAGKAVFRQGDRTDKVYYVIKGEVRVAPTNLRIREGELFGEVDVFTPDGRHIDSAFCETDVLLGSISKDKIREILFQEPAFSDFMLRAIARKAARHTEWNNSQSDGLQRTIG